MHRPLICTRAYLSAIYHRAPRRSGARIYFYHGLSDAREGVYPDRLFHVPSDFRDQVLLLKRSGIVSARELAHSTGAGRQCARGISSITIDDGYANNLIAAEILAKYRVPWTLFVSTGPVSTPGTIWTAEVSLLLMRGTAERVELMGRRWDLRGEGLRVYANNSIKYAMKRLTSGQRLRALQDLRAQFPRSETERLLEVYPAFKMLSWDDVRQLAADGVEIGSHGVDHEVHHDSQDPDARMSELSDSKRRIEMELGKACDFFAFPNGNCCQASRQEARDAGYTAAFTTVQDAVSASCDCHALPRLVAPMDLYSLARCHGWDFRQRRPEVQVG